MAGLDRPLNRDWDESLHFPPKTPSFQSAGGDPMVVYDDKGKSIGIRGGVSDDQEPLAKSLGLSAEAIAAEKFTMSQWYGLIKVRAAADKLREAINMVCCGYPMGSGGRCDQLSPEHPLAKAMAALWEFEERHARMPHAGEEQRDRYDPDNHKYLNCNGRYERKVLT